MGEKILERHKYILYVQIRFFDTHASFARPRGSLAMPGFFLRQIPAQQSGLTTLDGFFLP
jgi:hypothetical protein